MKRSRGRDTSGTFFAILPAPSLFIIVTTLHSTLLCSIIVVWKQSGSPYCNSWKLCACADADADASFNDMFMQDMEGALSATTLAVCWSR